MKTTQKYEQHSIANIQQLIQSIYNVNKDTNEIQFHNASILLQPITKAEVDIYNQYVRENGKSDEYSTDLFVNDTLLHYTLRRLCTCEASDATILEKIAEDMITTIKHNHFTDLSTTNSENYTILMEAIKTKKLSLIQNLMGINIAEEYAKPANLLSSPPKKRVLQEIIPDFELGISKVGKDDHTALSLLCNIEYSDKTSDCLEVMLRIIESKSPEAGKNQIACNIFKQAIKGSNIKTITFLTTHNEYRNYINENGLEIILRSFHTVEKKYDLIKELTKTGLHVDITISGTTALRFLNHNDQKDLAKKLLEMETPDNKKVFIDNEDAQGRKASISKIVTNENSRSEAANSADHNNDTTAIITAGIITNAASFALGYFTGYGHGVFASTNTHNTNVSPHNCFFGPAPEHQGPVNLLEKLP